ncbi:DUF2268 domain-containing protein [Oceanobacillus bengalensis]|uniref:Zn-dependent protease n=1 Tax=Oceanobacillus bengalensis TaxID=1435466 RepID=A0A494YVD4_9BACI|nr:DUF2268 domain-containing putative Zn-dependent protease [Oceanobacillus bengalensis]RKQ14154.1 Zn-dependent protease [Oceanobacillus bengalensis]
MSVIRTDKWLLKLYDYPIDICEKLKVYFADASASEVYEYLSLHGMYQPTKRGTDLVKTLRNNNTWEVIEKEHQILKEMWDGPDIPIFIFPLNSHQLLKRDVVEKSGLAFKDKLFLFVSEENTEKDISALFTHEYNHVCRLTKFNKKEEDYVLLDTIVLEGLAEYAVCERFGEECTADWTSFYSDEELKMIWNKLIYPNRNTSKNSAKHHKLLYGAGLHPKMSGYCVGYYLVNKYVEAFHHTSKSLFIIDTEMIAKVTLE